MKNAVRGERGAQSAWQAKYLTTDQVLITRAGSSVVENGVALSRGECDLCYGYACLRSAFYQAVEVTRWFGDQVVACNDTRCTSVAEMRLNPCTFFCTQC
jgi:hypothetical protein